MKSMVYFLVRTLLKHAIRLFNSCVGGPQLSLILIFELLSCMTVAQYNNNNNNNNNNNTNNNTNTTTTTNNNNYYYTKKVSISECENMKTLQITFHTV